MLATFVIGLREGLEAALIVGIIAAFLRRNGKRLAPMWIGVAVAVALSLAVGLVLAAVEQALPQAAQEGMESIIGAVAVVFVTGMIAWMNTHSRGMKAELEQEAGAALREGHAYALAVMAFLAVLKEGFETSVFLLATFTASTSAALAALGALLGVLAAVAVGIGIYLGGVRLNLSRFFRITGVFLILVAAGLVLTTLRTAHEAGWLSAGQQQVLDLSWLVRPGSVPAALITGVLGIPADPRLIEVVGWVSYLVPVALFVYWPRARRARGRGVARVQAVLAGATALAAIALLIGFAIPSGPVLRSGPIAAEGGRIGEVTLTDQGVRIRTDTLDQTHPLRAADAHRGSHAGMDAAQWQWTTIERVPAGTTLTLDQLTALSGGRLPIGISRSQQPGPFAARGDVRSSRTVWLADGQLLDADGTTTAIVTLSGGGLTTPRTVTLGGAVPPGTVPAAWHLQNAQSLAARLSAWNGFRTERVLWGRQLPIALGIAALVLALFSLRTLRRVRRAAAIPSAPSVPTPQRNPEHVHSS